MKTSAEDVNEQYSANEWFLITHDDESLRFVEQGVQNLPDELGTIGHVFWDNLYGAYSTASTPQMFAFAIARRSLRGQGDFSKSEVRTHVSSVLSAYLSNEFVRTLLDNTLRQSLVATWTSIEVLASDLFIELVNRSPTLAHRRLDDPKGQKLFQYSLKALVTALQARNFDMSSHMGDFLARQHPIDDVESMRAIFKLLFPKNQNLIGLLNDKQLWRVHKVRNLIVHRGAIIDEEFCRTSGLNAPVGEILRVKPSTLHEFLMFAGRLGLALLESAQILIEETKSTA